MIASTPTGNSIFSTDVRLALELGPARHSVAAVGPERLTLTEPQQLNAGDAVLVISVNGEPRRTPIRLTGASEPTREYEYTVR